MSTIRPTLLDVAKRTGNDLSVGLLEESLRHSPELEIGHARTVPGREFRVSVRTGLPGVQFRHANQGIDPSKSTFDQRLIPLHLLAGRIECDEAVARAHEGGAADYLFTEGLGVMMSAYRALGDQFYYGVNVDGKGFPGLIAQCDPDMVVDREGTDNTTSVWLVAFGERDLSFVFGRDTVLNVSEPRIETLRDEDDKAFPGFVSDVCTWVGLQAPHKHCIARIENIGDTEGHKLVDDLIFEALEKFPAGIVPTHCFMNKRSLRQLRQSRVTDLNVVPEIPRSSAGLSIIVTDSVRNDENSFLA
ncbi:MAG: hypothetical protein JJU00_12755 [Opitutales bacterium]|nr:hypothetical protein [Opitutales bacterium]